MLKFKFLPKLCTGLCAVLLLSGCTEVLSFSVGFGAGFFSGMQYQKSQIKGENSIYMGAGGSEVSSNSSIYATSPTGAMGSDGGNGGNMDYYASGAPTAPMDPYGGGTYPAPAPVYSAPIPGSASPQMAPPPLAQQSYAPASPQMAYGQPPQPNYGMAPPVQPYGGGGYYRPNTPTPAPFGVQGQMRPSAYSYTTTAQPSGAFW